jgi:hypothetical protein
LRRLFSEATRSGARGAVCGTTGSVVLIFLLGKRLLSKHRSLETLVYFYVFSPFLRFLSDKPKLKVKKVVFLSNKDASAFASGKRCDLLKVNYDF